MNDNTTDPELIGRRLAALSQAHIIVAGFSAISAANSAFNASQESHGEIRDDICSLIGKLYVAIGLVDKAEDLQPFFAELHESAGRTRAMIYGESRDSILDAQELSETK